MASITTQIPLAADADRVWAAVRDVGRPDLLFAGVLTDARIEGDERVVTFADGMEVRERIVTVDDDARRFAYAVVDGPFRHHSASFAVTAETDGTSTLTWVTDVLPDELAPLVGDLMRRGAAAATAALGC
ncbi:MAG TPA: SRPBCC family protein [Iamia sp.]|nr:SRPBCC family protein [Iamia sp.]